MRGDVAHFDFTFPMCNMNYRHTFIMPPFKSYKNRYGIENIGMLWKLKTKRKLTKRRNKNNEK